ncbi:nucleoside triphosphate pyrophosphatase [Agaribacterium sp. ZY112]|uniref:Maf family protein n=1 Tax=Agaribacterium sp. ZY112 TaxID=3233574 RepID=UPI003525E7C5
MKKIILASSSVYRKQQLQRLNIAFTSMAPEVDEDSFKTQGLEHIQVAEKLALAKAQAIAKEHQQAIVIGGDQVASFKDQVLNKPLTKDKAFTQLRALAGNEHQLITSLAIVLGEQMHTHTCIARMTMRPLSDEQIQRYIEIDEPLYCCGSYRLEAAGISLFESINCEDYTSIIGIPLMWTAKTLSQLGIAVP